MTQNEDENAVEGMERGGLYKCSNTKVRNLFVKKTAYL